MPFNIPTRFMNLTLLTGVSSAGVAGIAYRYGQSWPLPLSATIWHTAAAGAAISVASTEAMAGKSTGLFGKLPDGHIPWLRWLAFWPFHVAAKAVMWGYRLISSEPRVSEIKNGWYLGGCPTQPSDLPPGPAPALLDVTCEMPRGVAGEAYLVLRSWETHGLTPEQIQEGVQWGLQQKQAGRPVLVYCTHGHGRSAIVLCALLIADGLAASTAEAKKIVTRARPGAKPNKRQWEALEVWYQLHGHKFARAGSYQAAAEH